MISHILDFIVDYFTNVNIPKIIGGVLVLIGTIVTGYMIGPGSADRAVLFGVVGSLISGIGFVVIYYDMAKDKQGSKYNELETLNNALKQKEFEERKITAWNMNNPPEAKPKTDNDVIKKA
jgi:hypothetical protein